MRTTSLCTALLSIAFAGLLACGEDDHSSGDHDFDELVPCVDEHVEEGLPEPEAIVHCLADYELGQDFTDFDGCVEFVTENGGYEASREEACTLYFEEV